MLMEMKSSGKEKQLFFWGYESMGEEPETGLWGYWVGSDRVQVCERGENGGSGFCPACG